MEKYSKNIPKNSCHQAGFTIVELIAGLAIFGILLAGVLAAYSALAKTVKLAREKTVLSALASQNLEIVRNLPYSQVGTLRGVPAGSLPDFAAPVASNIGGTTYNIYYEVTWVDDPADGTALTGDATPTDYKQVKMDVKNMTTQQVTSFVSTVAPKGLETPSNTGVLRIKVLNAAGQLLPDVDLSINGVSNGIQLAVQTDSNGEWTQVGLPPGVNAYHVIATKAGYNTDQTYPLTAQNPNPTNPDPTIAAGQVTLAVMQIDLLGNLTIKTLNNLCQPLSGIGVHVQGAKIIGTNPTVYRFDNTYTSGPSAYPTGQIVLNNIEWDTYTPTLTAATLQNYNIRGTSPIQKIDVLPGSSQTFSIILTPPSDNSLLVIVKDASTKAPLEGAAVELQKGGSQPQDYFGSTGGSVWVQNDWSGGAGQANFSSTTPATYWSGDPNIYVNNGSNNVELLKVGGHYVTNATSTLESSTFDTGTSASNYTTLEWSPISQDAGTTLVFQLAANDDSSTWNYAGPDGTANTYYTVSGTNIGSALDNKRYIRYKAFLRTTDQNKTPVLSSIKINYVSGCFTPGQYLFDNITPSSGTAYTLIITLPGYQTQNITVQVGGNGTTEVLMSQ